MEPRVMTMSLVLVVVMCLMQGARAAKLTACESAIYFCCDPYSNSLLPLRYLRNHVQLYIDNIDECWIFGLSKDLIGMDTLYLSLL